MRKVPFLQNTAKILPLQEHETIFNLFVEKFAVPGTSPLMTECLGEVTNARGSKLIVSSLTNDGDVQMTINEKIAKDIHENTLNGRTNGFREEERRGEERGIRSLATFNGRPEIDCKVF